LPAVLPAVLPAGRQNSAHRAGGRRCAPSGQIVQPLRLRGQRLPL